MVFICQKCGKRAKLSGKNVSHRLASEFKHQVKRELGKGEVRIALTTCMDICPEDGVAIAVQPTGRGSSALFFTASIDDVEGSSEALLEAVRRLPIEDVLQND
jgi:predicted metal-binding protein